MSVSEEDQRKCGICRVVELDNGRWVYCEEGHKFCVNCFQKYAEEIIFGLGKSVLICMSPTCAGTFAESAAEHILGRYAVKILRENRVTKCTCDCKTCDWKKGTKRAPAVIQERLEREERLTNDLVRRCPTCDKAIVKEDGCDHMICASCTTHFCYSCRSRLAANDYSHRCLFGLNTAVAATEADPAWFIRDTRGIVNREELGSEWPRRFNGRLPTGIRLNDETAIVLPVMAYRMDTVLTDQATSTGTERNARAYSFEWREQTSVEKRLNEATRMTTQFKVPRFKLGDR